MAATKRSQNKCLDCKYTWYPKGKDLSARCPECASVNVTYAGTGLLGKLGLGAAIVVGILVFSGKENSPETSTPDVNMAAEQLVPTESMPSGIAPDGGIEPVHNFLPSAVHNGTPNNTQRPLPASSVNSSASALQVSSDVEKIYSEDEISQMEIAKQYQGDDPIVRRRLGLPSRETGKLIP
ncbi:Uncharacterized conserved protein [Janthinobacterium sp. Marseille]|uniref:Uncharacterized protein n=1 Tax=Herminiimonas aquatilis TaxID=345342 RepID=A0ABW2J9N2_9BURK|nr:hypothetical protein [Janthinobacterium sp. Marseille]ABR91827.1 Uncharacterized conserved protein [Janthinobacterium sp. Marseille]